ncbi:hypothetical protein ACIP6I_37035 [Streptomyces anulatus]
MAVLDEATAESGAGDLLRTALARVTRGRTSVVVAHRLDRARDADRIVLLAGGRVAEEGSHDELLAHDGAYAARWRAYGRGAPARGYGPDGGSGSRTRARIERTTPASASWHARS